MKPISKILSNSSIRHLLFAMVSAGILIMLATITITSTWITNQQLRTLLLDEGLRHAENMANNSQLALLYSSPENAQSAINSTLSFNDIDSVAIYSNDFKQFIQSGEKTLPKILELTPPKDNPELIKEDENHWHFIAPIILYKGTKGINEQLFKNEPQQEVIGYVYLLLKKSTLNKIKSGILFNNLAIAVIISSIMLALLHLIIKSLTRPLQNVTEVMKRTELGEYATHSIIQGPIEVKHIIKSYNRMVNAIAERDNKLRKHNIQLEKKATLDHLTGLINRSGFEEALTASIEECKDNDITHILCFMDLDKFKAVNDSCGHNAGDELLIEICNLFKHNIRKESDILARIGGDEFALILKNCSIDKATKIANTICKAVESYRFHWDKKQYNVGVSIGATAIDRNTHDQKELLSTVDSACYIAKEKGRGQVYIITPDNRDNQLRSRQKNITEIIQNAITEDQFELFCQKIIPLKTIGTCNSICEISIRLPSNENSYHDSSSLMEAAERNNLSVEIDQWVIDKVFSHIATSSYLTPVDMCTINISSNSINNINFVSHIKNKIDEYKIEPNKICLELSEASTIGNLNNAKLFIEEIHKIGCFFSLDNFGGGSLTFDYLKQLGADFLKVESVLIRNSANDDVSNAMVKAINDIAHILNIKTIAGSVESGAILEHINNIGFDYAQGFALNKPKPLTDN